MEALYTAVATSVGGRSGHVKSSDGIIDLEVRPPAGMGGPAGKYANPELLFAAGYSACFGSALAHVALQRKLPHLDSSVTARVSIGRNDAGGFQLAVEMDVEIKGVDQPTANDLVQMAHQVCPYSNATRGNVEVTLKATALPK